MQELPSLFASTAYSVTPTNLFLSATQLLQLTSPSNVCVFLLFTICALHIPSASTFAANWKALLLDNNRLRNEVAEVTLSPLESTL